MAKNGKVFDLASELEKLHVASRLTAHDRHLLHNDVYVYNFASIIANVLDEIGEQRTAAAVRCGFAIRANRKLQDAYDERT